MLYAGTGREREKCNKIRMNRLTGRWRRKREIYESESDLLAKYVN